MSKFELWKLTWAIRLWGLFKIPMVFRLRPSLLTYDNESVEFKIPLIRANRNHLNSMYFGALSAGADLTAGFIAMNAIRKSGERISMVFKSLKADFLKRAEGDVHFVCDQAAMIRELVSKAASSGEREEMPLRVTATVPAKISEPVATFELILSVKKKT